MLESVELKDEEPEPPGAIRDKLKELAGGDGDGGQGGGGDGDAKAWTSVNIFVRKPLMLLNSETDDRVLIIARADGCR